MNDIVTIGQVPWSRREMVERLEEFAALYQDRPIRDNSGGMRSPHMFLSWFALKKLNPKVIIESGVWLGGGTWFFEKACPEAKLICIEPNLGRIQYRPKRAEYMTSDFSSVDWSDLPKDDTLVFFDDHQNAFERVKSAQLFGFKHLLFEDNYPPSQGDCYSLKKVFKHAGFKFTPAPAVGIKDKLRRGFRTLLGKTKFQYPIIPPNQEDARYLYDALDVYYEFPPIIKSQITRWGDPWDETNYPTPEPLLTSVEKSYQQLYWDEAAFYTWMCYARLK